MSEAFTTPEDRRALLRWFVVLAVVVAVMVALALPSQAGQGTVIGSRPAGCPARFCGCALSLKLFGKIIPKFNLSTNWKALPATSAAPGMVAAKRGHVLQLVSHVRGNRWKVWTANSCGRRICIQERNITSAYTFHNPFASNVAMVR